MVKKMGTIDVFSCGIGDIPYHALSPFVEKVQYVFGSASLLASLNYYIKDMTPINVIIDAKALDNAKYALDLVEEAESVLVLCSGDALYNAFGGTLSRLAIARNLQQTLIFHPHITAFQALFHKLGMAWEKARFFSAHSMQAEQVFSVREMIFSEISVIYGGTQYPAHVLAEKIMDFAPSQGYRNAVAAEFLGNQEKERIVMGTVQDLAKNNFASTSILLLLPCPSMLENLQGNLQENLQDADFLRIHCLPLGLPETVYEKEKNLITASDARAIILSRLRLPQKGIMWDLGAGSGSVGLEAASLCPSMHVHSVEQNKDRIPMIEQNKKSLGIGNYTAWHGDILAKIEDLDAPHRIFIGGGGKDIVDILNGCAKRLKRGGIIVVSAVTLESFHALHAWGACQDKHGVEKTGCIQVDIAIEEPIANMYHQFKSQNTLYIFTYGKQ